MLACDLFQVFTFGLLRVCVWHPWSTVKHFRRLSEHDNNNNNKKRTHTQAGIVWTFHTVLPHFLSVKSKVMQRYNTTSSAVWPKRRTSHILLGWRSKYFFCRNLFLCFPILLHLHLRKQQLYLNPVLLIRWYSRSSDHLISKLGWTPSTQEAPAKIPKSIFLKRITTKNILICLSGTVSSTCHRLTLLEE